MLTSVVVVRTTDKRRVISLNAYICYEKIKLCRETLAAPHPWQLTVIIKK